MRGQGKLRSPSQSTEWEGAHSIAPENLQNWVAALNTRSPETLPPTPGGLLKQALVWCTEVVQASRTEGLSIQTAPQVVHPPKPSTAEVREDPFRAVPSPEERLWTCLNESCDGQTTPSWSGPLQLPPKSLRLTSGGFLSQQNSQWCPWCSLSWVVSLQMFHGPTK